MPKIVDWEARFQQAREEAPQCACKCGNRVTPSETQLKRWKRIGGRSFRYSTFLPGHQGKNPTHTLTPTEYQVIAGSSLGDGCLYRKEVTYAPIFIENHGPKQEEYVKWKAVQLAALDPIVTYHKNGGYGDHHVRVCTKSNDCLTPLLEARYPEPTREYIESLTALGWAVWFMDDGSSGNNHVRLAVNGRQYETMETIQEVLQELGFDTSLNKGNPGHVINFKGDSRQRFLDWIAPHIIPSMEYKLEWITI